RGKIENNSTAVSFTGDGGEKIATGNKFTLNPGETWCVIESAEEGASNLTVLARDIADYTANRVYVTQNWFDASYAAPPPVAARPGEHVTLSTRVYRQADNVPLAGYWVRYTVLDGPTTLFQTTQAPKALVQTDSVGKGAVLVYQPQPLGGRTRISFEILRPD